MTRLASAALSLALVLTIASCGDDDKPAGTDGSAGTGGSSTGGTGGSTGGTGGSTGGTGGGGGGAGGTTACTGSFMGINQAQLAGAIAAATGDKKCAAATDVALICTGNIATIAGTCGQGCASMPSAMVKGCVATCIMGMVNLSAGCSDCYAGTVACTTANCLSQCLANPAAPACTACQVEKGCRSAFATCSGLPTGPAGDGGVPTGDGGAIDAASSEGGTSADGGVDAAAPMADSAASDSSTD
jgi:hypothetical protein